MKPELVLVRTVEAPQSIANLGNGPYECVGLLWLSTTEWIVVHTNAGNETNVSILTVKKNQPPFWDQWKGFLPRIFNQVSSKTFKFFPLFDWHFILASATCYSDIYTISNDGNTWKPCELREPFVIHSPMSKDCKETYFVGGGLDLTATNEIQVENDGTKIPPQPIIYLLTTDGVLLLYHVASLVNRPSLNKPVSIYDIKEAKNGQQPAWFQPAVSPVTTNILHQTTSIASTPTTAAPVITTTTPQTTVGGFFSTPVATKTTPKQSTAGNFLSYIRDAIIFCRQKIKKITVVITLSYKNFTIF